MTVNENKPRAYILDKLARIGDEVYYQQSEEAKHYVDPAIPDGTKGVVVGFRRHQRYIGRNETWFAKNSHEIAQERKAGLYESNSTIIVDWEVPTKQVISAGEIYPVDHPIFHWHIRVHDEKWNGAFDRKIRIGDLPELPYYEDDIVELNQPFLSSSRLVRIRRIDYERVNERCTDGVTPIPLYTVSPVDESGPTTCVNDVSREPNRQKDRLVIVRLVERGIYWHRENDPANLKFKSIEEEVAHYHAIGLAVQVRNPVSHDYGFTIRQAVQALKDKVGAGISMGGGFTAMKPRPHVYAFPTMPEFEERLRASFNYKEWEEAFAQGKYPDEEDELTKLRQKELTETHQT